MATGHDEEPPPGRAWWFAGAQPRPGAVLSGRDSSAFHRSFTIAVYNGLEIQGEGCRERHPARALPPRRGTANLSRTNPLAAAA